MAFIIFIGCIIFMCCMTYMKYDVEQAHRKRHKPYIYTGPDVVYVTNTETVYVDRPIMIVPQPVSPDKPKIRSSYKKKAKVKTVKVEKVIKPPKPVDTQLEIDAINFLISMGEKKPSAKEKVHSMFNAKAYNNIEDFITDIYRRPE